MKRHVHRHSADGISGDTQVEIHVPYTTAHITDYLESESTIKLHLQRAAFVLFQNKKEKKKTVVVCTNYFLIATASMLSENVKIKIIPLFFYF